MYLLTASLTFENRLMRRLNATASADPGPTFPTASLMPPPPGISDMLPRFANPTPAPPPPPEGGNPRRPWYNDEEGAAAGNDIFLREKRTAAAVGETETESVGGGGCSPGIL